MKKPIILAGGSGLIGRLLAQHLSKQGQYVVVLTRDRSGERNGITHRHYDPEDPNSLIPHLEDAQAVVGLAGATVDRRYDARGKWNIMHSRTASTLALGDAIAMCQKPPQVWVQMSTATIYRHATDRPMDQYTGELGSGFSVEVARSWEAVASSFSLPHTRTVLLRSAMVMSPLGGVLPRLVQLTRMGLGGRHGSGDQFVSWIHAEDLCRAVEHVLQHAEAHGIYDLAAPEPVRDGYLMAQLAANLRPLVALPKPRWMLEAGAWLLRTETELVLKSRRVVPTRLLREGFAFRFPGMTAALMQLLRSNSCVPFHPVASAERGSLSTP